jgi:hypothetical protein
MGDWFVQAERASCFDLAVVNNGGDEAECLANAHLIAAAPDLLEACKLARDTLAIKTPACDRLEGSIVDWTLSTLSAAIRKAEGGAR